MPEPSYEQGEGQERQARARRAGVLLLNMGGPASLEEVPGYLRAIFLDPEIIPLPLGWLTRPLLARLVPRLRARKVRAAYERIGGGSPLPRIARQQADALRNVLRAKRVDAAVEPAMRYGHPSTEDALGALERQGAGGRVVAVPLYPHFSYATTGSSFNELLRIVALRGPAVRSPAFRRSPPPEETGPCVFVDSYFDHPLYLAALERRIRDCLEAFPAVARERTEILFSAHGLPESFIRRGDPYSKQIEATFEAIRSRLPGRGFHLAYQSRVGPAKWIGPPVEEKIAELAGRGVRSLLVVAVSFTADNLETLDDLDIRLAGLARGAGIEHFRRAPVFNDAPDYMELLAELVREKLGA